MLTALADGRLLAEKTGDGTPTVVALHGWMRTGADFAPMLSGLNAVAPNFPGASTAAEPPADAWGSPEYAELVADAIRPFAPVVIVAHSFGGRVAVNLAAKHPELVRGLVLTGVPLMRLTAAPKAAFGFRVLKRLVSLGLVSKKRLEAERRKRGSVDYNATQGVMRDIFVKVVNEDYRAAMAALKVPVRMVWGENDTSAPADAGKAASKLIEGATFRVVAGAGHLLDGDLRSAVREELVTIMEETHS
ncbi:MAG: alpha/beta fold hydrolase [Microbacteriaceae bacterium]